VTPRTIVFVATRVLALWCFVSSVSALSAAPAMDWGLPGEMRYGQAIAVVSLVVVPLVCGMVLWSASAWLADRACRDAAPTSGAPLSRSQLFTIGTSLLGVVVVVEVLPELAQATAFAVALRYMPQTQTEPIDTGLQLQRWVYLQAGIARFISLLARFIIGVVLAVGPAAVWRGLREYAARFFGPVVSDGDGGGG